MDSFFTASGWLALLTLTFLEIVLGVDNVIFISILSGKLPQDQQASARRTGLLAAMANRTHSLSERFEAFSKAITQFTGSTTAFGCALGVVIVWGLLGPVFGFSDTWQLVINTGTTIVTFLMVFLIQRTQNKDSLAIHLKLNELVSVLEGASNRLIDVEDLTEEELRTLHSHYAKLVAMSRADSSLGSSHSVEEAQARHSRKNRQVPGGSQAATRESDGPRDHER